MMLSPSVSAQLPQRLIVDFNSPEKTPMPLTVAELRQIAAATAAPLRYLRRTSGNRQIFELPLGITAVEIERVIEDLRAVKSIKNAEIDLRLLPAFTPDDSDFAQQWYLSEPAGGINATSAWDLSTGSSHTVIAVIDTGIQTHSELSGVSLSGYDFVSDANIANDGGGRDNNPADPGDWITPVESANVGGPFFGCTVADSSWHGTKIAGLLVAKTNNSAGIAGIDHQARLLPVRVLGKCGGFTSDLIDAIRWAAGIDDPALPGVNPNPAHIINLSLGGLGACSTALQSAIDDAVAAGAVVVSSAGNNGAAAINYTPGNCGNVINVAASTREGGRTAYTNFGSGISLSAPGGNDVGSSIYVTSNSGLTAPGGQAYTGVSGSSFAAPMVSGVAALIRAIDSRLSVDDIRNIIETSARPFPAGTGDGIADCTVANCGNGLLDANAALIAASNGSLGGSGNGEIHMAAAGVCVTENDGSISVEVVRENGNGQVSVSLTTRKISADPDVDFIPINEVLTWADGDFTNKSVNISVRSDTQVEASEYFSVRLNRSSLDVDFGAPASTTVTIISTNGNTPRSCTSRNSSNGAGNNPGNGGGGGGALLWLSGLALLLHPIRQRLKKPE